MKTIQNALTTYVADREIFLAGDEIIMAMGLVWLGFIAEKHGGKHGAKKCRLSRFLTPRLRFRP